MRSNLWNQEYWINDLNKPDIPRIVSDHAQMKGFDSDKVAEALKDSYSNRLY
jgi:hypothetical protein